MKPLAQRDAIAGIGAAASLVGMAASFRGPRQAHWRRLALTHGALGIAALATDWSLRPRRPTRADILAGAGAGLGLFAMSSLGEALTLRSLPRLRADASILHDLSLTTGPAPMCGYLALVIAPGEELLWRGLVQGRLERRFASGNAALMTSILYSAAHVPTGNRAVTAAATGAGAALSTMRAKGAGTTRLMLAHACWVVLTLLRERTRAARGPALPDADAERPPADEGKEASTLTEAGSMAKTGRKVSPLGKLTQLANNSLHTTLYQRTRGRLGTRMLGNQVGILTTTRPRDGQPYAVPLFTFQDGPDVIVVGSYRGSASHPAWYRNLLADPVARIQIHDRTWTVLARVMDGDDRAVWWEHVVRGFGGYAEYQSRTNRELPLIRLTPHEEPR